MLKGLYQTTLRLTTNRYYSTFSNINKKVTNELNKYRNIGIIAHVDAGKTTTCERMLYYSGSINRIGEVHKGDTVMDYLKLERERGITIGAATVTIPWNQHRINIVDTPGHVDFTVEVERSVRVMDGSVAIFDAVAGVQAQSITVWNQSERYKVPRIAFVNKMDREGATMEKTLKMMVDRLHTVPIPIQYPVSAGPSFEYVVDLIDQKVLSWSGEKGEVIDRQDLKDFDNDLRDKVDEKRNELIQKLSDLDEEMLQLYLENDGDIEKITKEQIKQALRRVTMQMKGVPVMFGSSLQNKGVQQVLDSVVDYLPSPIDRDAPIAKDSQGNSVVVESSTKGNLVALAFKVVHDKKRGLVVYTRVYSGILKSGSNIYNSTRKQKERLNKLMQVSANEMEEISELKAGDIGALLGLKNVCTGDTLIMDNEKVPKLVLKGIQAPPPVFFCTLEAESEGEIPELLNTLAIVQKEDPSFQFQVTDDQQILISGMGELHLEIIKDRLDNHFKINTRMGKMQVSYKGTITCPIGEHIQQSFDVQTGTGVKTFFSGISLNLEPNQPGTGNEIIFNLDQEVIDSMDKIVLERIKEAITEGLESAFQRGLPLGFPVVDTRVTIDKINYISETDSPAAAFRTSTIRAFLKLGEMAHPVILEPLMKIELSVDEKYLGSVLSDLSRQRRATINEVGMEKNVHIISAVVPLKEMIGYSTQLRSLSSGNASFNMEFLNYGQVSNSEKEKVLKEIRGY